uniref:Protocadherin alpha-2-like n=1 Tax=Geotrypetes seraphini TaxID=260995 RepID=A0A6P8PP68_GEOSA|nr:protocadherin alpha-2-like [Geotrypetes seraphini]
MAIISQRLETWKQKFVCCLFFFSLSGIINGQIRYAILEELDRGSFIGDIAKDLGMDISKPKSRGLKIISRPRKEYIAVNMENGYLFVNEKIDREELCGQNLRCSLNVEAIIDNPLEIHRIEVEILDLNDHSPAFPVKDMLFNVSELALIGTRFPLEKPHDPDVGINSLQTYEFTANEYFELKVQENSDGSKSAELVLNKALDRELQSFHQLKLIAFDGGNPRKSSDLNILINVLDANDNAPVFDQAVYRAKILENAPKGSLVIKLNATDLDEGQNGEIRYYFGNMVPLKIQKKFGIHSMSGEIITQEVLDFEDINLYEIQVSAIDKGSHGVKAHCKVLVELIDVNDNAPEVNIKSLSTPIAEDIKPGTVIALISISDKDSGVNGKISSSIPNILPFTLQNSFNNYYSLILKEPLDRETVEQYNISITTTDQGSPSLSTTTVITVKVSDVNDNKPQFTQPQYIIYVTENNIPGTSIYSISAVDSDLNENGSIRYSNLGSETHDNVVSINPKTGEVYALKSFDFEDRSHFQFQVLAEDGGVQSLKNNASVDIFIVDANDNPPLVLPSPSRKEFVYIESIPLSAPVGYFVSKVRAVDMDSGYNAWLSYHLLQNSTSLFHVGLYTGEIRTVRSFREHEEKLQKLAILVKDHGKPPLSSAITLNIILKENIEKELPDFIQDSNSNTNISDLNLYLVISIAFISFLFLITVITYTILRMSRARSSFMEYTQPPCPGTGGSWCYSQNQLCKVRLSAEVSKSDCMVFNRHSLNSSGNEVEIKPTPPETNQVLDRGNLLVSICNKSYTWRTDSSIESKHQWWTVLL